MPCELLEFSSHGVQLISAFRGYHLPSYRITTEVVALFLPPLGRGIGDTSPQKIIAFLV